MGTIIAGIVVAVVIAIGAGFIMRPESMLSWQAFRTVNVRVGDPGSNLVGPRWTGENRPGAASGASAPSTAAVSRPEG